MARISKKKFKAACRGSGGVGAIVAKAIGVGRSEISEYLKKHPEMRKFLDEEGERVIDISENIVDDRIINQRDLDTAKWKLLNSKKGKARGYGSKQELEHSGKVFDVNIQEVKNGEDSSKPEVKQKAETSVGNTKR